MNPGREFHSGGDIVSVSLDPKDPDPGLFMLSLVAKVAAADRQVLKCL